MWTFDIDYLTLKNSRACTIVRDLMQFFYELCDLY